MTTIKVNDITNVAGTGAPNFSDGLKYNGAALSTLNTYEYTSSATEPSNPSNGALWWDSTNSEAKIYVNNSWKTVTLSAADSSIISWSGDRGLAANGGGTYSGDSDYTNAIEYYDITTTGNASVFGDSSVKRGQFAAAGNRTRGLFLGGRIGDNPGNRLNTIDYITISTTGNAQDFGDLTGPRSANTAAANATRALCAGGWTGYAYVNTIDYVTIDTTGNALDFGDLSGNGVIVPAGTQDDTRAIFAGSIGTQNSNIIEYVTIATTGNTTDFGDLTEARDRLSGVSNNVRGIIASDNSINNIEYVTIQTTGNSTGFGDLSVSRSSVGGAENTTRACFAGGSNLTNVIDFITMDTTGNAQDFGDLVEDRNYVAGNSGAAS